MEQLERRELDEWTRRDVVFALCQSSALLSGELTETVNPWM